MARTSTLHRRDALKAGIVLPFGILLGRRARGGAERADPFELSDPVALAGRWSTSTEDEAYALAAQALQVGLSAQSLNGAVLLAAVTDIPPRPEGGPLHAALVVESSIQLALGAGERVQRLAGLWCLGDYLSYRTRVRAAGVWTLPPTPDAEHGSVEEESRELVTALEEWDAPRADRALCGLVGRWPTPALFEALRPFTARCFTGVGHKLLYAVQLERVLERLDARVALPALRSLVTCLVHPDAERDTSSYALALELAAELPPSWESGRDDPAASRNLVRSLRGVPPSEAQELLARTIRDGVGPTSAWSGLRLFATDLFLRRPSAGRRRHLPVHPVTELNAFDTSRRRATTSRVRGLLLLQAAAWLARLAEAIERQFGPSSGGDGVFAAEARASRPMPAALSILRTATQDHQLKYAAAAIEEATRTTGAFGRRILTAGTVDYLPEEGSEPTERYLRAVEALER